MPEIIIAEKPSAALKIAQALADGKPVKKNYNKKIPYYELKHKGKKIIVVCAVGHLYTVAEKNKKGWTYPVFDVEWKATYEVSKGSAYTKDYLNAIKKLCKGCKKITIATDYDIEGEVIGYNIVRFACGKEDARRMKFSTTTKDDLVKSYAEAQDHLDWLQAEAGLTRHELDFFYGINLSRALTLSIKNATGLFQILSSGRVQGPTLKILAKREKEIKAFKPKSYWLIELITKELTAWHKNNKFWDKKKADKVIKQTKKKPAVVDKISKKSFKQDPPNPFDLTALQIEAYKQFGISPKETLSLTQELYINSYVSYPRTSSNQLPESIGYRKLLKKLSKQVAYKELCDELLSKKILKPNNGKKKDPAHPACHPTGEIPKKMSAKDAKIYDLIVRRMLASFAEVATRETVTVNIDVNKEIFVAKGTKTVDKGWHKFYGKYAKFDEEDMPQLGIGQNLKVKNIEMHDKETQPPKRYTSASIIKELESKNLGTKATRSHIVDSLFNRNYLYGKPIEVTDLGLKTIDTLHKYCPDIIDEHLTREFEEDMEKIREKKRKGKTILRDAIKVLTKILETFKKNETKIGKALGKATRETREHESHVGVCNKCGGNLRLMYSRKFKSRFVACGKYPKCKNTFSLPIGLPKVTDRLCPECKFPLVMIIRAGKRPFDYCINKQCPKKLEWLKKQEELAASKTNLKFKTTVKEKVKNTSAVTSTIKEVGKPAKKKFVKKKVTKKKSIKKKS